MPNRERKGWCYHLVKKFVLYPLLLLVACEYVIVPAELDPAIPFSLYGSLDGNGEIQWIRVTPIRDSLFNSTTSIDAQVTLSDNESKNTVEFQDSLFHQIIGQDERIYYHNFWAKTPVIPGRTYTIKALKSDGYSSSAVISIPAEYEVPTVRLNDNDPRIGVGRIMGGDISRLVVLDVAYDVTVRRQGRVFNDKIVVSQLARKKVIFTTEGKYYVDVNDEKYLGDLLFLESNDYVQIDSAKIFMAAGNDSWPNVSSLTYEELLLPEVVSNVEGGVGLVVGINTKVLPFKSCVESGEVVSCAPLSIPFTEVFNYNRLERNYD